MNGRPHIRDGAERRAEHLEEQLAVAKALTWRLWNSLGRRVGRELDAFEDAGLSYDAARAADASFDASQRIWERDRILVEPCRRILDPYSSSYCGNWPTQDDAYIAYLADGTSRALTRGQLLMMAGLDERL